MEEPIARAVRGESVYPFSNLGLAVALVRGLNSVGYGVDVLNWDSQDIPSGNNYDLFVGHGGINFDSILRSNKVKKVVYFASGSAAHHHNREAQKRSDYFFQRHKVRMVPDRPVDGKEDKVYSRSSSIICLGNKYIASTFKPHGSVYNLNIATSPKKRILLDSLFRSPKNFLFFSGAGNLHKGLDIAIESIIGTDCRLYVCTEISEEFRAFYTAKYTKEQLRNIHFYGFVRQGSRRFKQLVRKCEFVMLLSCSEGSPGSVVDLMQYGLIPVLTRACGIDLGGAGKIVEDIEVESVRRCLLTISGSSKHEIHRFRKEVGELVKDSFSEKAFSKNLRVIMKEVAN